MRESSVRVILIIQALVLNLRPSITFADEVS